MPSNFFVERVKLAFFVKNKGCGEARHGLSRLKVGSGLEPETQARVIAKLSTSSAVAFGRGGASGSIPAYRTGRHSTTVSVRKFRPCWSSRHFVGIVAHDKFAWMVPRYRFLFNLRGLCM